MSFNSLAYWLFLAGVLVVFYLLGARFRWLFLLAASYFFYMWWNPLFVFLILFSTLVDYGVGLALPGADRRRKKLLLLISLSANLGLLGFFKYYNFFADSAAALLGLGAGAFCLQIVLPVGISFYTFQSLSYTIDIYRGELKPVADFPQFALYVSFFPQLVAGPIVRARDFLPQLSGWRPPDHAMLVRGSFLIIGGLIKKMVFADCFAVVADGYFADPRGAAGLFSAWSGVTAFAMQIFFDFSGYTDIALGSALLLGFTLMENFKRPYLARGIRDFWHRWHISLSQWLRDYLYIPLGGNKGGLLTTCRNLAVTMLLGGLWHGAQWTFVVWGGYQGLLLAGESLVGLVIPPAARKFLRAAVLAPLPWLTAQGLVFIGWAFFRAESLGDSFEIIRQLFDPREFGSSLLAGYHLGMIAFALVWALGEECWGLSGFLLRSPAWLRVFLYVTAFLVLELFSVSGEKLPFVYFQF